MNPALTLTLQVILTIVAVVSSATSVWVAFGNSRRLRSGEAKALSDRVDNASRWHETPEGKKLMGHVSEHAARLDRCEERLSNTATRADVAILSGKIDGVVQEVKSASAGIDRIEHFFLENAIRGRSGAST